MEANGYDDAVSPPDAGSLIEETPPSAVDAPDIEQDVSAQPINPRQQQIDPEQYQNAIAELQEWRRYGEERQSYDQQHQDWLAQQQEAQAAREVETKLAQADQMVDRRLAVAQQKAAEKAEYDPKGAIADLAAAAAEHQRYYRTQRTNIITTLEQRRQQDADRYAIPEVARHYAQQHELDDRAAQVLMNLPPQQIPAMAEVLGMTRAELKQTQQQLQAVQRTQQQQAAQRRRATTPPPGQLTPSTTEPDVTSDEFLRDFVLGPLGLR